MEGRQAMLLVGTTVELDVTPSSVEQCYNRNGFLVSIQQIDLPQREYRVRLPRMGNVAKLPPMLRLDSTSSSSNFFRLMERVELQICIH